MSDHSTNLQLPFLAGGQAQKHITVNESLTRLDALVQLSVASSTTNAEPGSPADGAVYILPAGATGTHWGPMADHALAYYRDGAWEEITPREGWIAAIRDSDQIVFFTGSIWVSLSAALRVSATDRVLGRISAGAGAAEEIAFTDQAQQLCDDTSFTAMRTTLGAAGLASANVFTGANTLPKPLFAANGAWTSAGWGKAAELAKGTLMFAPKGAGSYAWGWGVSGDTFYVLRSTADDNSAGGVPAFSCSPSAFVFEGNAVFYGGQSPLPSADNSINLGSSSFRFGTLYATTGTINTSDAREKTELTPLPQALKRAVRRVLSGVGAHQWHSAVATKGETEARLHIGVTAQAVRDAFVAEGVDPERWALFCADPIMETTIETTRTKARVPIGDTGEFEEIELDNVEPTRTTRPVLDEHGLPLMRLGLRTDQLMWLVLATLAEEP